MSQQAQLPTEEMTMKEQAEFLDYLIQRCTHRDGSIARETSLLMTPDDVRKVNAISHRLRVMAPYHSSIKRMVLGK